MIVTAGRDAVAPSSAARRPDRGRPGRVDRWYIAYALLGATQGGMIPILLPLTSGASGGAAHAGAVMAAVNLGGLAAPLWGYLADRWSAHRAIMVGGLAAAACGLMAFAIADTLAARTVLALLVGVGMAAANTAATLLVIDAHPREEWDPRLGALQTFYGAGQTLGLTWLMRSDADAASLSGRGRCGHGSHSGCRRWLPRAAPPAAPPGLDR